jgi:hypothetical protein
MVASAGLAGLGACSEASRSAGAPDADVGGFECTPGGRFELDGRAAVLGLLNVHINASGLVETDTTSELLIIMDSEQNGSEVDIVASLCGIEIPDVPISGQDQPIRFEVPAPTVASVKGVPGSALLSSPSGRCVTFGTQRFTIVLGAKPDPIDLAELPEADGAGAFPACAPTALEGCDVAIGVNCVCDQERDGQPGATLRASNIPVVDLDEVYVALRTQFTLEGLVLDSDNLVGTVEASIEQGILGCRLARGDACHPAQVSSVKQLNPKITQQPGNPSTFRAVRIGPELGCAELIERKDELFPL